MWRPNEPVGENVSNLPGIDPHSKRGRSRRRAWRDGSIPEVCRLFIVDGAEALSKVVRRTIRPAT
jgi:hypothetical protein